MPSIDDRIRTAAEVIFHDQQGSKNMGDLLTALLGDVPSEDVNNACLMFAKGLYQIQLEAALALVVEDDPSVDPVTAIDMAHTMALGTVLWQGAALGKQLGIGEGAEFASQFNLASDNDDGKDADND